MLASGRRRSVTQRLAIQVIAAACMVTFAGALPSEICGIYCAATHAEHHMGGPQMSAMPCHQGVRTVSEPVALTAPLSPAAPAAPTLNPIAAPPTATSTADDHAGPTPAHVRLDVPPPRT